MKVGIVLDNNVSKVQVHPFEIIAQKNKDIEFVTFIGEKNKSKTEGISLSKTFLNRNDEILHAIMNPVAAVKRLKGNRFPRMDYYYFSLSQHLKDFSVVYSQDISRSLYTLASLKERFGYKILLRWWEVMPYKRFFNEKDSCIANASLDKVDMFIPATNIAMNALLLEGIDKKRVTHLYPGVDIDRFSPERNMEIRKKLNVPSEKIVALFVGRLVTHKGIFVLLWAAKLLKMSLLNELIFVIVGDGGQRKLLEEMVNKIGLRDKFIFTGAMPYDAMPGVYKMSDIFILPSLMKENIQEQFGLVIAEALACGKPVIGSAVGGIPEVIGGSGIIVPPGDYRLLADAIKMLTQNQQLRRDLGQKGRQRAEELFSGRKNAEKLLTILRSLQ